MAIQQTSHPTRLLDNYKCLEGPHNIYDRSAPAKFDLAGKTVLEVCRSYAFVSGFFVYKEHVMTQVETFQRRTFQGAAKNRGLHHRGRARRLQGARITSTSTAR